MNLLALLGSPRAGGNTDTLAAEVLKGAEEAGATVETVALRRLDLKPCTGCEQCWHNDRPCVLRDGMESVYEAIAAADALLFVTPVYWYGPTTLLKTMLDRFVVFNRPQGRPLIDGKPAAVVVAYEEEGPEAAEPLLRMFELSFAYLGMPFVERLVVDGVGPKGAVLERPEALASAREMGKRLGLL